MNQYDFNVLSPADFELLSRDLLQREFEIVFESFKDGKDGGIDFRFIDKYSRLTIVQCKRISKLSSLLSQVRKEKIKISDYVLHRYILTTSLKLSPKNKSDIIDILGSDTIVESDIFGGDDLNNLLNKYPEIELKYFKLWLSSTNVMNRFLNKEISNRSLFMREKIQDELKYYVQDSNLKASLKLLSEDNFVILSGGPGVGKSTLAHMLVYVLIAEGYEDFIYIGDSISDAFRMYEHEKKQIFFFDDFLGESNLKENLSKITQSEVDLFVDKIRKTKNKKLIFVSRDYLLKQAKEQSEGFYRFYSQNLDCLIELQERTRLEKAHILFNHLYFGNSSERLKRIIVESKLYLEIIQHENFNPRLIESIVKFKIADGANPSLFVESVKKILDNPSSVWLHSFNNELDDLSRILLWEIYLFGGVVSYEDLFYSVASFQKERLFEPDFRRSIEALNSSFISAYKVNGLDIITFANPSIRDFLAYYIDEHKLLISSLIEKSILFAQLVNGFAYSSIPNVIYNRKFTKEVVVPEDIRKIFEEKMMTLYEKSKFYNYTNVSYLNDYTFRKKVKRIETGKMGKLDKMFPGFRPSNFSNIHQYVLNELSRLYESKEFKNMSVDEYELFVKAYSLLFRNYEVPKDQAIEIVKAGCELVDSYEDFSLINCFKIYFPDEYIQEIVNGDLSIMITEKLIESVQDDDEVDVEEKAHRMRRVIAQFGLFDEFEDGIIYINTSSPTDYQEIDEYDYIGMGQEELLQINEDSIIEDLFKKMI